MLTLTTDLNIVAALADLPNATSGLTAAQLKAKFDEGPNDIKTYINSVLVATLNSITPSSSGTESIGSAPITGVTGATPYDQLVALKLLIDALSAGTGLSNGSVTSAKIALLAITTALLADSSVTSAKIVDGTIVTGDIADSAITSAKIVDGTIVNADINASAAIDGSKLANLSITSSQIADGAIMNVDINAAAEIDASKIGAGAVSNAEYGYLDGVLSPIQAQINGVVLGAIPDGTITPVKLSFDPATQAELDAHIADYTLQVPYGGSTTGSANTYVLASPAIASLTTGMAVSVKFNVDSSAASTLNWNSKGAKGIKKANGTDVTNLKATGIYTLRYDGTNFILQGEGGSGNATAPDLLSGKTATTDAGDIVGTMAHMIADQPSTGRTVSGTTLKLLVQPGYYDGTINVTNGDANFIAANILAGITIFGVAGNVGRSASGTATITTNLWNITGLAFAPSKVFYYSTAASGTTWSAIGMASLAGDIYENGLVEIIYGYNQGGSTALGQHSSPTWGSTFVNGLYLGLANSVPIKWWAYE